MANAYKSPVIVLDTFAAALDIGDIMFGDSKAAFWIDSIEWIGTSQGNAALITDGKGNTIFEHTSTAASDSHMKRFGPKFVTRGIKIGAAGVDGGKIHIALRVP